MPHSRASSSNIRVLTGSAYGATYDRPVTSRGSQLLLVGGLVLAGCSGGSDLDGRPPDIEGLLGATLVDVDTKVEVDLSALASRDAAIWFWTPVDGLCGSCVDQAALVAELAPAHPDVVVVPVAGRAANGAVKLFLEQQPVRVENCGGGCELAGLTLRDPAGSAWGAVPVITAPVWLFLDDGVLVAVTTGPLDGDDLDRRLQALTP